MQRTETFLHWKQNLFVLNQSCIISYFCVVEFLLAQFHYGNQLKFCSHSHITHHKKIENKMHTVHSTWHIYEVDRLQQSCRDMKDENFHTRTLTAVKNARPCIATVSSDIISKYPNDKMCILIHEYHIKVIPEFILVVLASSTLRPNFASKHAAHIIYNQINYRYNALEQQVVYVCRSYTIYFSRLNARNQRRKTVWF